MDLVLRFVRKAQGISTKEVAERVGVVPHYIALMESGYFPVSARFRKRFIDVYGPGSEVLLKPANIKLPYYSLRSKKHHITSSKHGSSRGIQT